MQRQRFFSLITLGVIFVLFIHSVDTCSGHLGVFSTAFNATSEVAQFHPAGSPHVDGVCATRHDQAEKCCNLLTEIAVVNTSQYSSNPQLYLINIPYFIVPARPRLVELSKVIIPRAGPSFAAHLPLYLRSSLPVRAPPFLI
jgi:hypothetical protein